MANKRRLRKVAAPYRRFIGTGIPETGDGLCPEQLPGASYELRLLSRNKPARARPVAVAIAFENTLLPLEILSITASFTEDPRVLLLVNKAFYLAALPYVYRVPKLTAQNYLSFCETLNTSPALGYLVRELDLAGINQSGRNSLTAKLLKRCAPGLEIFRASQTQFGLAPLLTLRGCKRLRILDLGLISSSVDLPELFTAIECLQTLEVIKFPRCSIKCMRHDLKWPPNLHTLGLAGGINSEFVELCDFPTQISRVTVSNCPQINTTALKHLLSRLGIQLVSFAAEYPLPHVSPDGLDDVLQLCPRLRTLRLSVDYFSRNLMSPELIPPNCQLRRLDILSSGMMGHSDKVKPGDVLLFADKCKSLRIVQVSIQLGWSALSNPAVVGLAELLDSRDGGLFIN